MNKFVVTALALGISSASFGSEFKNFSAEVLLGEASQKVEDTPFSGNDTSIGIRGSYLVNKYFAIELAYQDYGNLKGGLRDDSFGSVLLYNFETDTSAFNVGVKGAIPLGAGISLNGRLGLSKWNIDIEDTNTYPATPEDNESDSYSENGVDLYAGIGAQLDINDSFFIGAEYSYLSMGFDDSDASFDIRNLALTAGLKF